MNKVNTKNIENINKYFYNLKLATRHLHVKSINDFDIVILPPTGPECICNAGFDYAFIENYNNMKSSSSSSSPLPSPSSNQTIKHTTFICGSFGAYRTLALLTSIVTNQDMTSVFYNHIIDMTYKDKDSPETLEVMMSELRNKIINNTTIDRILKSDDFRMVVIVNRLKPIYNHMHVIIQYFCMFLLGCVSIFYPIVLQDALFDRLCFYTGSNPQEMFSNNYFDEYHTLTIHNFSDVLKASSCIPGITVNADYIDGIGKGIYMDGGLSDINIGFKVKNNYSGVVLHSSLSLFQNYFQSVIKYPNIPADFLKNLSVIFPSKHCIKNTPDNRLAYLSDWFDKEYISNPNKRKKNWKLLKSLSQQHLHNDINKQLCSISSMI